MNIRKLKLMTMVHNLAQKQGKRTANPLCAHPARASLAQKLSGSGIVCFEGEMLDMPVKWHPASA